MKWVSMGLFIIYCLQVSTIFSQEIDFYGRKKLNLKTQLLEYPKAFKLDKQKIKSQKYYYKIYKNRRGKVFKAEQYMDGDLVNHYFYEYHSTGEFLGKLFKEEFYDNQVLIQRRLFFYYRNGSLMKIETQDSKGDRNGDMIYFDEFESIKRLDRYRNNKVSFVRKFEKDLLRESQYHTFESVKITEYQTSGQVLYEENVKRQKFIQEEILEHPKKLILGQTKDIKKITFMQRKGREIKEFKDFEVFGEVFELQVSKKLSFRDLNPERYGLLNPERSMRLWMNDGEKIQVFIGNFASKEKAYFVALDIWGEELFLIEKKSIDFYFDLFFSKEKIKMSE